MPSPLGKVAEHSEVGRGQYHVPKDTALRRVQTSPAPYRGTLPKGEGIAACAAKQ